MLSPYISVEVMNIFLEQFTREIPHGVHVVMVWDQAGFHTGNALKVPENITIVPLPPYSPELNPMENLWHYLRSHYWSNRTFGDYGDLCDAGMTRPARRPGFARTLSVLCALCGETARRSDTFVRTNVSRFRGARAESEKNLSPAAGGLSADSARA